MDGDVFLDNTNPKDVSVNTIYSKEMMAGSHITELQTHKHEEPIPPEVSNKVLNKTEVCDAVQNVNYTPQTNQRIRICYPKQM